MAICNKKTSIWIWMWISFNYIILTIRLYTQCLILKNRSFFLKLAHYSKKTTLFQTTLNFLIEMENFFVFRSNHQMLRLSCVFNIWISSLRNLIFQIIDIHKIDLKCFLISDVVVCTTTFRFVWKKEFQPLQLSSVWHWRIDVFTCLLT